MLPRMRSRWAAQRALVLVRRNTISIHSAAGFRSKGRGYPCKLYEPSALLAYGVACSSKSRELGMSGPLATGDSILFQIAHASCSERSIFCFRSPATVGASSWSTFREFRSDFCLSAYSDVGPSIFSRSSKMNGQPSSVSESSIHVGDCIAPPAGLVTFGLPESEGPSIIPAFPHLSSLLY